MRALTVGEVAARAGLSAKAIRLYEARGLVPPAARTAAGYRVYGEEVLPLLLFIRQARALGLSLTEIQRVVDLQRSGAQPCGTVLSLLDRHIEDIDRRLGALRALRRTLVGARTSAASSARSGGDAVVCRLIEAQPAPEPEGAAAAPAAAQRPGG